MKNTAFLFSVKKHLQLLFLCLFLTAGHNSLSAASWLPLVEKPDTTHPALRLPCYHQMEKEVIQSGLYISTHATSIPNGVVDFFTAFAKANRTFRRCLKEHYPLGKR